MAVRYCEEIDFDETCSISGVEAVAVGQHRQNGTRMVLVAQQIIESAAQFIDFKFGHVPTGGGAFIWSGDEQQAPHGVRIGNDDVENDCSRFFRLMKIYEHKMCS